MLVLSYDRFMSRILDNIDIRILEALQRDSAQSQRALSDKIGMSQNAYWRRLKALEGAVFYAIEQ
jgi:Lrp/AsnC family transcriptional regulator